MVKMNDDKKTLEKIIEDLCEDIVNIARVLPNLTPLDLQTELLELKNDPDRVTTILRKHFKYYNEERENSMSQDIKMVKRVIPRTPIVQISKDLADVAHKKNRVQLVLKKYFSLDVNPCKRSLETTDSPSTSKILKIDESTSSVSNLSECTSDHLLPTNSPNKIDTEQNIDILPTNTINNDIPSTLIIESNVTTNIEETVSSTLDVAPETNEITSQEDSSSISNTVANEIVDSISKILSLDFTKQYNVEINKEDCTVHDNSDERKTLFQIVNNLYPDLVAEEMELILAHLNISIYDSVDENTLNIVLNEIINYFENKETFEHVETNNDNTNMKTDTQSTESSSTEEYDLKDELTEFFGFNEDINSTSSVVVVKQESPHLMDLPNYTDKNLGLISEICRGIDEDRDETENNCEEKSFISIASGTDNWVKSALGRSKDNPNITSTSELNDLKPVVTVKTENCRKRSVCSTVTSASVNAFGNHLEVPQTQQIKQENVLDYVDYGLDLTHPPQQSLSPLKLYKETENNWSVGTNHAIGKPARNNIERPPRDNLKSSLSNNFCVGGAGHSRSVTNNTTTVSNSLPAYNKNFIHYLQNRNNIDNAFNDDLNLNGLYLENDVNLFAPKSYLPNTNNQAIPIPNTINNNNLDMSKRSSMLTKKEEKEMKKALLCELGNGKCNACKKCLKNTIALKVRNDLFRRNTKTPESSDGGEDVVLIGSKPKSSIPIVDLSESSSSNSNPIPGTSTALQPNENHPFYYKIMEMFPDICPDYLRVLCNGKDHSSNTLDHLISSLLETNYNRRERAASPAPALEFDEQYKTLLDLFPDADPTYLQQHCERLYEHPNEFKEFVASLLEHKNYPSKEEYLKKMNLSAQQKQYTTEFDVKKFLEVIPNPEEYFKNRNVKRNYPDQDYALTFLKNQYCHLSIKDINIVFRDCQHSIVTSALVLDKLKKNLKTKRKLYPVMNCLNIPLLQEIAYVKHKNEILNYMKQQEHEKIANRQFAKNAGLLKTCECCYDDEVMPEEMACCENGHVFCKECVKKGCEVKIGEGKLNFPCLTTCEAEFTVQVLQTVLTPKVFSKMAQKKQLEEVKSAGIEDLEFCPFCDFATIPAPGDKLFRCLNNDCMKESCRECKEPSHIPLRCDEVEKENDVKLRTYIEDKMTEALVRKCYKCNMKFIKEEGCNKMTCSCGAMMCYVCNQPVMDYKHFNGQGGDQYHLCPLYSDTHKLHMDAVKLSAENAKKELGIANNQLKIDPTANLDQHYKRLANRNPQNLPPGMEQLNPQHIHIRIQEFHLARR